MTTTITARHFQLTDPVKDRIQKIVGEIEKYNLNIQSSHVVLDKDKRDFFTIEIITHIPGKGTVVVTYRDKDLYTAIDKCKDKLEKLLRRYHDRVTSYHSDKLEAVLVEEEPAPEVIEMPLDVDRPLSIEEAIAEFERRGLYFMVFKDRDGEKRVIYRRKDGNYGLY
jgi:putative sigma-54 modulation protein